MAMFMKAAGSRGVVILACLVGAAPVARAQDAAPPAAPAPCGFPCLFRQAPPPEPVQPREATPADPAAAPSVVATDETPAARRPVARKRKPPRPLTIAAEASEAARLKALAFLVPEQSIKVVTPRGSGAGSPAADMAVTTGSTSVAEGGKSREVRLFTEQLHVIAGPGITRITDLRDRPVSFGSAGSPSEAAARAAFAALGLKVKETPLDLDNALDGAASGDLDAVVVLAPQPLARLAGISHSGLHLVSWPEDAPLPQGAVATMIAPGPYPGLAKPGETIHAVGVDAFLGVSAKGAREPATRGFFAALARHSTALSKRGFDLLKADVESRTGRRLASAEHRAAP